MKYKKKKKKRKFTQLISRIILKRKKNRERLSLIKEDQSKSGNNLNNPGVSKQVGLQIFERHLMTITMIG